MQLERLAPTKRFNHHALLMHVSGKGNFNSTQTSCFRNEGMYHMTIGDEDVPYSFGRRRLIPPNETQSWTFAHDHFRQQGKTVILLFFFVVNSQ
jgi:hypothetical protein